MLNEAVLKRARVSQRNAGREGRLEKTKSVALMLDFLCGWERIQKGSTGSNIPRMQERMIFVCVFAFSLSSIKEHENTLKIRPLYQP